MTFAKKGSEVLAFYSNKSGPRFLLILYHSQRGKTTFVRP